MKTEPKPDDVVGPLEATVRPLCWVGVNKHGDVTHHSNARTAYAPIPVVMQRQLDIAMRHWDMWKLQALELNARLQKYEPGSPMHLNEARERPNVELSGHQRPARKD